MVNEHAQVTPNHLLKAARKERGWTKEAVAEYIGAAHALDVATWENGTAFPSAHYVEKLCRLFGKSARELGLLQHQVVTESDPGRLWNVPFPRNPFFTGRDDLLNSLHNQLSNDHAAALTQSLAITGLGGIGKTQTATEYAYRYREEYQSVFWVRAASRDTLIADFVALAELLALPG
jgi:transcriptional regulator with XRE-family HTH domain